MEKSQNQETKEKLTTVRQNSTVKFVELLIFAITSERFLISRAHFCLSCWSFSFLLAIEEFAGSFETDVFICFWIPLPLHLCWCEGDTSVNSLIMMRFLMMDLVCSHKYDFKYFYFLMLFYYNFSLLKLFFGVSEEFQVTKIQSLLLLVLR